MKSRTLICLLLFSAWLYTQSSFGQSLAGRSKTDAPGEPGASVRLSPTSVNFGTFGINQQVRQAVLVNLTNSGNADLVISSIALTGPDTADFFESNLCPSTLQPGLSCTIAFGFAPTKIGPLKTALTVTDNASNSPQRVTATGTGTSALLSEMVLNFGGRAVGTTSGPLTVKLTNVGTTDLRIAGISITGPDLTDFEQTNTCGSDVAAGSSCEITVTFTPSATGARSATLQVRDNGGGSPQNVSLSGTGT